MSSSNHNTDHAGPPPALANGHDQAAPHSTSQPVQLSSTHQVKIEQQHCPIYGAPLPIGIGFPSMIPSLLPSILPQTTIVDPFLFGASTFGGPLAPIATGNFLPGAAHGIGFGIHANGLSFPPPPPGAIAGIATPFASITPLWTRPASLAFGNVPSLGMGVGLGMSPAMNLLPLAGLGAGHGASTLQTRPAPMVMDGNHGFANQPAQTDPTQIAGGIPAGVALVESTEHTIAMVIKGPVCPWLSPGATLSIEPLAFSSSTGLNRLIQVCNGAKADECDGLAVTECIELGGGVWEKGQTFKYDDAVSRVLSMKDAGWDAKRNRKGGAGLHLWGHRV